ncbi:DUF4406 domain-containing protein [Escherichia coli]|uniref:DUF4406 domain-containing protein n=1 Tax=Escherichia coli TaxID=562 RepID=UPI0007A05BE4|nr:DUF4406 domain-containing protein [Escherichia coli]EEV3413835.1 DUF4406 domain-containing protein [Escherichia coli]EHT0086776.1 DUF4406 domain-containing protein [Escherichia coli]EIH0044470.1 DUF4406 domain-containing protein [Escherichia coli]EJF6596553.1 DUF4406 domain-containing protein [Escherichia coli]EJG9164279.1 DUF4406 domain-containing protein [Escherichia coli]
MAVIYIAGPMTGCKDHNRTAFCAEDLKLRCAGNIVLNPAVLPDGLSQQQYMSICIPMLMCADAIYLLDGWEESAGARAEYAMALKLNMPVSFPENRAAGETVAQLLGKSKAAQATE